MTSIFGPVITGNDVENAVTDTLKLWMPTYLAEMERVSGRDPGVLPAPRSWSTVSTFYQYNDQQLPAAIVVSPGTDGEPERRGDGTYTAVWDVVVAILVKGQDAANANELAKLYAAAVRMIALQKGSLGGFAAGTDWFGETNDEVPPDYLPVGWVTGVPLRVRVDGVVTAFGGPATPDLNPTDLGEVETAEIAVERIPLT